MGVNWSKVANRLLSSCDEDANTDREVAPPRPSPSLQDRGSARLAPTEIPLDVRVAQGATEGPQSRPPRRSSSIARSAHGTFDRRGLQPSLSNLQHATTSTDSDALAQARPLELNATESELAIYLLECAAVDEAVEDPGDTRRLRSLSGSMEQTHRRLWRGRSNDQDDVDRSNRETHFRGEVVLDLFKRELQTVLTPDGSGTGESLDPTALDGATSRELGATLATGGELVEAGPCGVQASLNAFIHAEHLEDGERVSYVGVIDENHAYNELFPSPQEQRQAAADGVTRHSVIGDPWLRGSARLKPHTRHARLQEAEIDRNFSISHSERGAAAAQFARKRQQMQDHVAPILEAEIQRMRVEVPEPDIHPLSGASVGDPAFDRRALQAIRERRPASRERMARQAVRTALGLDAADPIGVTEAARKVLSDVGAPVLPPEVPGEAV